MDLVYPLECIQREVVALLGILMEHGWGTEGFQKHPMTLKIVGLAGDSKRSARALQRRLQPTWEKLEKEFPGAFTVVLLDAPHVPKR